MEIKTENISGLTKILQFDSQCIKKFNQKL